MPKRPSHPSLRRKAPHALAKYRRMRDFDRTAEPSGSEAADTGGHSFVVQKHAASHLHYDFRLELDGVLKSWAVAKGPSVDPAVKRLAVETEDHPLAYGDFEGSIPKGQYGGGTVMVWDRGTWEPTEDARKGYKTGRLKFALHGAKMKGAWALVRMKRRPQDRHDNWLLIKDKDPAAAPGDADKLLRKNKSAKTARSMEAIAASNEVWHSNRPPKDAPAKVKVKARAKAKAKAKPTRGKAPPAFIAPELTTRVDAPPEGDDWLHEIKFDGYRLLVRIHGDDIRFFTRHHKDWTDKFPALAEAFAALGVASAFIDGEAVVFDEKGSSDFGALQNWFKNPKGREATFCAFDLLYLNGQDLRDRPLTDRKEMLRELLDRAKPPLVTYSDHQVGQGKAFFAAAAGLGVEGIISKRVNAPYISDRTKDWLKIKRIERQEFVIGGFVPSTTGDDAIGSLLMGEYRDGKLAYAGKVGTGYTQAAARDLFKKLSKLRADKSAFAAVPTDAKRGAVWTRPQLVAEIEFGAWTSDRILRHAAFLGLREDKTAKEVKPERILPVKKIAKKIAKKTSGGQAGDDVVRGVRISHPERSIYAKERITKLDVARYYDSVAEVMLPHVAERPLALVRCPEGLNAACFFQKHAGMGLPESIREERAGKDHVLVIDSAEGLVTLVQRGVLEVHCWGSHLKTVEQPDLIVMDFDPDPSVGWKEVVRAAVAMRDQLTALKLTSFVKTTGGKGLHVVLPIAPQMEWDAIKEFSRALAVRFAERDPDRYLVNMSKTKRKGRIFIDYLRNGRGATAVAPYSTRARAGGQIATPLSWAELENGATPGDFTIATVPKRVTGKFSDPWRGITKMRQKITARMIKKLIEKA